jgi:transcriptional regulator with XRE-family HTH domain
MMERKSKLEAARRLRGWTLEVASQKIGVHPQTLRRWETGKSKPHGFRIYKISEVYETTPAALDLGQEYSYPPFAMYEDRKLVESPEAFLSNFTEPFITIEDLDLRLMGLILQRKLNQHDRDYAPFQRKIHQCIREYDEHMKAQQAYTLENPARLRALHLVASIPLATYLEIVDQHPLPVPAEDILTHCASGITVCWHMSQRQDLLLIRSLISGYLILLGEIFDRIPYCQQAAAKLIAQVCLLRTMLALQIENPHTSISYYTKALEFSSIADQTQKHLIPSMLPNTLNRYGKQPEQIMQKIAESIWLLKPAPIPPDFSLIRDYLQRLSEIYEMPLVSDEEPLQFAENSWHTPPSSSEITHFPGSIDYAEIALQIWESVMYHELNEYAQELDSVQSATHLEAVCDAPEPFRQEFLHNRALASLRLHDMAESITTLRTAVPQALSLGNEQTLVEAHQIYHMMQFLQVGEPTSPASELKDLLKKHD